VPTPQPLAQFDRDRNGIFIHIDQLQSSPFSTGDRFAVKKGKRELFALKIIRDDSGDILLDKNGIFIPRSRRIDILLGGIFQQFVIDLQQQDSGAIVIRPLPEDIPR
jgi:hypothetical protein